MHDFRKFIVTACLFFVTCMVVTMTFVSIIEFIGRLL